MKLLCFWPQFMKLLCFWQHFMKLFCFWQHFMKLLCFWQHFVKLLRSISYQSLHFKCKCTFFAKLFSCTVLLVRRFLTEISKFKLNKHSSSRRTRNGLMYSSKTHHFCNQFLLIKIWDRRRGLCFSDEM